jgi:hydroxymethylglutaryl-CoA lyase
VPHDRVVSFAEQVAAMGVDEIALADTVGFGNPNAIRTLFTRVSKAIGPKTRLAAHFHDTRGLGIANVAAAIEVGVRHFDASLCGLGGCPFAPGATGNIVTEDVVFLAESLGFDTGIDLDRLIAAREIVQKALPNEALYGQMAKAGLPKGFSYAEGRKAA